MDNLSETTEIARLKQLLKLHLFIISQQQDALKKKDTEIAKLKTQSQNFKLQLERIRRRVSLNRRTIDDDPPIIETSIMEGPKATSIVQEEEPGMVVHPYNPNVGEEQKEVLNVLLNLSENQSSRDVIEALNNASVTMFPTSKSACKLCVECSNCSVAADTILKLLVIAANTNFNEAKDKVKLYEEDKSLFEFLGLKSPSDDCKFSALLETTFPFERKPPYIVEPHWWFQTDWNRVKKDDSLSLIPTYREVTNASKSSNSTKEDEGHAECTDDSVYTKRHHKFEQDEKRRKRWDIQRIREYRYTEKLKQRAIKHDSTFSPVLDSFYGYLLDADAIQVEETLPVNVFGYPLPHLEPEEFSLESIQQPQPAKKRRHL